MFTAAKTGSRRPACIAVVKWRNGDRSSPRLVQPGRHLLAQVSRHPSYPSIFPVGALERLHQRPPGHRLAGVAQDLDLRGGPEERPALRRASRPSGGVGPPARASVLWAVWGLQESRKEIIEALKPIGR